MQSGVGKCTGSTGNREVVEYILVFHSTLSGLGGVYIAYFSPDCIRGYSQSTASRLLAAFIRSRVRAKNPYLGQSILKVT